MNRAGKSLNLNVSHLLHGYQNKLFTPSDIIGSVLQTISFSENNDNVWIHRIPPQTITERAHYLESLYKESNIESFFDKYPLYGVPFAIKDNINVEHLPTTCGCPGYAYIPNETAECVNNALSAGAILIGKTNLDQFATGLNGTRTPYGVPINPYNHELIPGGSSSGSAVAVSSCIVSFALGTDTAGSGRVPAALNNIYGIKPSRNVISTHGVVPACKSLDCVSIFSQNIYDAFIVLNSIKDKDCEIYHTLNIDKKNEFKFGIPKNILNERYIDKYFDGDMEYFSCFRDNINNILSQYKGSECIFIDFEALIEIADLLYNGPWVTERLCALPFMSDDFLCNKMDGLNETVRSIICGAKQITAKNCFDSFYALDSKRRKIEFSIWNKLGLDFLCVPSIPTTYTLNQMMNDPIKLNSNLGLYTNFVNLLDLCGVAIPSDIIQSKDGLRPFGITLIGENMNDLNVMLYSAMINGNEKEDLINKMYCESTPYKLCVCGAHLSDGVLNHELIERGAKLFKSVKSKSNQYEMYSIENHLKPGLIQKENNKNVEIEMEIWCFPNKEFYADFIAKCVKEPLCIGTIQLNDNTKCKGFLMESYAINQNTPNITEFKSWQNYKKQSKL